MNAKTFSVMAVGLLLACGFVMLVSDNSDAAVYPSISLSYTAGDTDSSVHQARTENRLSSPGSGSCVFLSGDIPVGMTYVDSSKGARNGSYYWYYAQFSLKGSPTTNGTYVFTVRGTINGQSTDSVVTVTVTGGIDPQPSGPSSLTGTYDCQGHGGSYALPSDLNYVVGDGIYLKVDCECGGGITYSWSPSAPAGISIVDAGSAYPFYIRGVWQNAGNYTLHTDCIGNGCENDVTFHVYSSMSTVTYAANGGSVSVGSNTVGTGSQVVLPSATKQYCSFSGWYTAQSGGTRVGGAGDSYTVDGDITLYAQYNVVPVSFTTTHDTEYIVQGSSFSYTAGTSPVDAVLSVSGASWLSVSGKNVAGTASSSVNPGTYHVTLTASYGTQSAVQTFDIVVVEKLIFESVPTGGIIALPA